MENFVVKNLSAAMPTIDTRAIPLVDTSGVDPLAGLASVIADAKKCHFTAKRNAVEAAARAYIVWCLAFSPNANPDFKEYVKKQIDERNEEIEEHNALIDREKADASQLAKGKLSKKHYLMIPPTTENERKEIEIEKARLLQLHNSRSADNWKAAKQLRIEAIADAKEAQRFTECVRFVFDFVYPDQSSLVSRYAQALQWVNEKFGMQTTREAPDTIAESLVDFGGLEAVILDQRGKKKGQITNAKSARQIAQESKLTKVMEAANDSSALATIDVTLDVAAGIVVLLGRYKDGELELIQTLQVSDAEFNKLLLRYGPTVNDK